MLYYKPHEHLLENSSKYHRNLSWVKPGLLLCQFLFRLHNIGYIYICMYILFLIFKASEQTFIWAGKLSKQRDHDNNLMIL